MTIADGILAKEKPNTVCRSCEDGLRDDKVKECKQEDDTVREMPNRLDVRILSRTHHMRIHLMKTPVQIPIMLEKELDCCLLFTFTEPELIRTGEGRLGCDDSKMCNDCTKYCFDAFSKDDNAARECQGKQPGERIVIPLLPTTQKKHVSSFPKLQNPRGRRQRSGTRG